MKHFVSAFVLVGVATLAVSCSHKPFSKNSEPSNGRVPSSAAQDESFLHKIAEHRIDLVTQQGRHQSALDGANNEFSALNIKMRSLESQKEEMDRQIKLLAKEKEKIAYKIKRENPSASFSRFDQMAATRFDATELESAVMFAANHPMSLCKIERVGRDEYLIHHKTEGTFRAYMPQAGAGWSAKSVL